VAKLGLVGLLLFNAGCTLTMPWAQPTKTTSQDNITLAGNRAPENDPSPAKKSGDLAAAHEAYRRGDFSTAERSFRRIAENTKNSPAVGEEGRFYQAECLYRQNNYPTAADTYHKLLIDFPSGAYREPSLRRMFDIASYWLKDTDREMTERKEGKWSIMNASFINFDKSKPTIDTEGRALQVLEQVYYNDITGPLSDKALYLCGFVKFYREDYLEADHYFSQLIEMHKESPLAPKAIELGIICKNLATGGPDYDGRKSAEARQLIDTAMRAYPGLAHDKQEFLEKQMVNINLQQAEKQFNRAVFYERTGHPGSAYFCYELVIRRFPNTRFAEVAAEKKKLLESEMQKERDKQSKGEGFLQSTRRGWNRLWGLESPIDKLNDQLGTPNGSGGPQAPPSGIAPQTPPPSRPLPPDAPK
jgi:outer membrane protein assembly factor BamD (BamD/ComL family)